MRYYRLVSRILVASVLVLAGLSVTNVVSRHASAACSALPTDRGTVTATVNIQTAGTYRVWSRIKAPDSTNNSYLMQIDDTTCNVVVGDNNSITANTWTWVDYQSGTTSSKTNVTLTAGNHVFKLAGREDNVQLDRVVLTQDMSCVPTGNGNNCSDPADLTGPVTSVTAPTNGATITGNYTMTANATDPSGIKNVQFYIDGALVLTDTVAPYSYSFNSTSLGNGSHTFRVVATDNSPQSNTTTSSTITATVANQPTVIRPEDINKDGKVGIADFSILSRNYGKTVQQADDPRADISGDGIIGIKDFSLLSSAYEP
ncbi:MAG: Ig-like domain-containing protein [Candidatus Saccharimonadales bacterium]